MLCAGDRVRAAVLAELPDPGPSSTLGQRCECALVVDYGRAGEVCIRARRASPPRARSSDSDRVNEREERAEGKVDPELARSAMAPPLWRARHGEYDLKSRRRSRDAREERSTAPCRSTASTRRGEEAARPIRACPPRRQSRIRPPSRRASRHRRSARSCPRCARRSSAGSGRLGGAPPA